VLFSCDLLVMGKKCGHTDLFSSVITDWSEQASHLELPQFYRSGWGPLSTSMRKVTKVQDLCLIGQWGRSLGNTLPLAASEKPLTISFAKA